MTWHVAACLETLRRQLNTHAPRRSTKADGAIGDAAHASRKSDHNPWYQQTVTARDYTHDPAGGLDCNVLAGSLIASNDPRIKYIIWNRRIWERSTGWRPYSGINAHSHHLHLSVVASAACEDARPWALAMFAKGGGGPMPVLQKGAKGGDVERLQKALAARYPDLRLVADGDFGAATDTAVKRAQRDGGLAVDGVAGPRTYALLALR